MFGSPKIQVSYNARLRRARVQFTAAECFKSRHAPLRQLDGIKLRFDQEKEDGYIETYALFTRRFEELWTYIRSLRDQIDPKQIVKMTIGQGGRLYQSIALEPPRNEQELACLSCSFPGKRVQNIPFNAFVFNIMLRLEQLKIKTLPDRAQLRFLYLLLKNGQNLVEIPLKMQPQFDHYGKYLLVQLDEKNRFATLHLFDPRCLATKELRERTWKQALIELNRLNKKKINLTLLKEHSLEKLESLAEKMQGIGFSMPYDLLIAYDSDYRLDNRHLKAEKSLAEHEQADLPRWKIRLGAKHLSEYFQVELSADAMSAKVAIEHPKALQKVKASIDLEWIERELSKQGIVHGFENHIEAIWKAIQADRSLIGAVAAKGTPPQEGHQPYLHLVYLDKGDMKAQQVDMRESQNRQLAKQGDLLAEIRFSDGKPGSNVRGEVLHARGSASTAHIQAGDGVIVSQDARFFAKRDGLVTFDGKTLLCQSVYVHKGSINLSSGNLAFEGAVVVQGDIESGASVNVRGQLQVEGMIGDATVRCSGAIDVKGGIVTGSKGWVHAGGQIRCNFIENSEVQARGGVLVQRSILNSTVIADGPITLLDSRKGVIAGGSLSSWTSIRTAQCGMGKGSSTECRIGSDFNAERRLKRCKLRTKRLQIYVLQLQKGLKEFEGSGKPSQSAESQQQIQLLQKRLQKAERIADRLEKLSETLEHKMHWNTDATLVVTGVLDKAVHITAAGRKIPLSNNLEAIFVTGSSFRGSQLIDLEEMQAFQDAHPKADFGSQKKSA